MIVYILRTTTISVSYAFWQYYYYCARERKRGVRVYSMHARACCSKWWPRVRTLYIILLYTRYTGRRREDRKKKLYGKRARKVSAESIVTRHTAPESGVVVVAQGPQGVKKKSWPKTSEKRYYYLNVAAGLGNRCLCTRIMLYGSEYDTRTGLHVHKIN